MVGIESMSMDEITQGQGIASEVNKTKDRTLVRGTWEKSSKKEQ